MIKIQLNKKALPAIFAAAALSANIANAEDVIYKTAFDKLKPGMDLFKISPSKLTDKRQRMQLFPDKKPEIGVVLKTKNDDFSKKFDAVGTKNGALKITPKPASSYPLKIKGELVLRIPRIKSHAVVAFKVKFDNYLKRKKENYFFIYAAGANIWFRGETKDLRVYDVAKKKYDRVLKIKNGEIYDVKIDLRFGKENLFDLTVNGKKLLTDAKQRGKPNALKIVRVVIHAMKATAETPNPTVYLKSLTVKK